MWIDEIVQSKSNDKLGMLLSIIAPCIIAPIWEEILYRGFLMPCLNIYGLSVKWCIFVSGLLFACHHAAIASIIPLTALGILWAFIYVKSGNLIVTMVIHALWNLRVFLDGHI